MIENKIAINKTKILFSDKTTKIEKTPGSLIDLEETYLSVWGH